MNGIPICRHGNEKADCSRCEKRRAYVAEWRRANADKVRAYSQKWQASNPDKRAAVVASWRKRNPGKVAAMSSKAGAKWSRENNGKRNALTNFTRAKRKGGFVPWSDKEKITAIYIEAAHLSRETGVPHEVDHIIPLRGDLISGLHVHYNLQIVTRTQNRSKGKRVSL